LNTLILTALLNLHTARCRIRCRNGTAAEIELGPISATICRTASCSTRAAPARHRAAPVQHPHGIVQNASTLCAEVLTSDDG